MHDEVTIIIGLSSYNNNYYYYVVHTMYGDGRRALSVHGIDAELSCIRSMMGSSR